MACHGVNHRTFRMNVTEGTYTCYSDLDGHCKSVEGWGMTVSLVGDFGMRWVLRLRSFYTSALWLLRTIAVPDDMIGDCKVRNITHGWCAIAE